MEQYLYGPVGVKSQKGASVKPLCSLPADRNFKSKNQSLNRTFLAYLDLWTGIHHSTNNTHRVYIKLVLDHYYLPFIIQ
jgi:hypothetical protein